MMPRVVQTSSSMGVILYFIFCLLIPGLAGQLTARLINGTYWAGRLEIFYGGEWSTVCDDGFGQADAQVACRMMGLSSLGAAAVNSSAYGAGTGKILLDSVACRGTETNLAQCRHRGFYSHNCVHTEDVGVICPIPGQLPARLVGRVPWTGRLEIFHEGSWKTVCDDEFGQEEAQVTCRMLGYNSSGAVAVGSAVYGQGQGDILLDDLNCQGTEPSLAQCQHPGYGKHNCGHREDVSVSCNAAKVSLYIFPDINYPLLEGTSVKLKCWDTQQGQSGVVYTWPETAGGHPLGEYLILNHVTRAHHGRRVRCAGRGTLSSDALEIQVYYRPSIRVTCNVSACENLGINQYVITQNQNVTFSCDADSNPSPASTRWSGKMSVNTGQLQITAADNVRHSGQYTCTVTTDTVSGDSRLPLMSSQTFNIAVKYPSRLVKFQLNVQSGRAVIRENSTVRMLCEANGRPTPHMVLVSGPDNHRQLASRPRGEVTLFEQPGVLSYVMNGAPCEASGDYRCEVDNGIGNDSRSIRLVVLCRPRRKDISETLPSLDVYDNKGLLTFKMTANPTPSVTNTTFMGPACTENIEGTPVKNTFQVDCVSSSVAPASVTCNITAVNMTRDGEGCYKIVFSNGFGHLPFIFQVNSINGGFKKSSLYIVVGAAAGGVVVVAALVFLIGSSKGKTNLHSKTDKDGQQVQQTKLSLQDFRATWVPNVYHCQKETSCPPAGQEEESDADELYVNTAEIDEDFEDSDHDYTNVENLWRR